MTAQEIDFIAFSLIIDDIVFPDGRTAMGVLGGGGPQSAFGLKLWADQVGLVSGVGSDLSTSARAWLEESGIDTRGLRSSSHWPTPRAWQLLEADGRRTQVWRVSGPAIQQQLGRSLDNLPPGYRRGLGYHLGVHPEEPDLAFIQALREAGAVVSIELFRAAQRPLANNELVALLSAGHIFSLNQAEACSLVGPGEPLELIQRLVKAGATIIALRQGAKGALVHRAETAETWRIPAITTNVVDPTGAGNAFCGGFLAGWVQTGDLRLAGLYGAVAASFLVEQVGLPQLQPDLRQLAQKRLAAWAGEADRINTAIEEFTVKTAQMYAQANRLEEWIHTYLNSGYWANLGLSEGLRRQQRWWLGPLEVPLSDLVRACGPEMHMEYRVDPAQWETRITTFARGIHDPLNLPPLIVQYRQGVLSIRDGNHRYEALRRQGHSTCWVLIWYDYEEDFLFDRPKRTK